LSGNQITDHLPQKSIAGDFENKKIFLRLEPARLENPSLTGFWRRTSGGLESLEIMTPDDGIGKGL
jgi:hypothetical protein